jgi:hypothetical protein
MIHWYGPVILDVSKSGKVKIIRVFLYAVFESLEGKRGGGDIFAPVFTNMSIFLILLIATNFERVSGQIWGLRIIV